MEENCRNCRYYKGEHCNRFPPVSQGSSRPCMGEDNWCGEWKAITS